MIKVLIVDDSAFMRKALNTLLEKDKDIQIVGTASNGKDALALIPKLDPDVITLDIEMPVMDGLTALQYIMRDYPRPVLMVSSLTVSGAEVTLKAMDFGAVDFIAKPQSTVSLGIMDLEQELQQKVKAVARRRPFMRKITSPNLAGAGSTNQYKTATPPLGATNAPSSIRPAEPLPPTVSKPVGKRQMRELVAIGVSTGGPPAVQKVLAALPENFPAPILIAQHMPAAFTGPFAKRLDALCKIEVKEAENGEKVRDGVAYVCPGGKHIRLEAKLGSRKIIISDEPKTALYKPSANELIASVGEQLGMRSLAVVLTGMGSDGLEGVKVLKAKGGRAIAQNEESCVVYGMPKAIVDAKLADEILEIDAVAAAIMENLYK